MKKIQPDVLKGIMIGAGVLLIFLSVVLLALGVWEGFGSVRQNVHMVTVPGFHSINFKSAGNYMGLYQHTGRGPVPIKFFTGMEYRLISKDGTREAPVVVNKNADIINRAGQEALIAFSFMLEEAGEYTLSAFNLSEEKIATEYPVIIFGEGAQGFKQSLVIAALFFALFLGLGIFVLIQAKKLGAPPTGTPRSRA